MAQILWVNKMETHTEISLLRDSYDSYKVLYGIQI